MTTSRTRRSDRKKDNKKKKSALREWVDSIVFAVVAATIIRWLFIEAYMIPTPSMENSLLVGDYLFVSKMHYGARTPATPLQVPLTFQKIWGTNIPSYLDWMQLPMYRLPGFSDVERYDPIVFNYPAEGTGVYPDGFGDANDIPPDMRTYYIKRCIGLPGDKLEVRDQQVYIDGEAIENPKGLQTTYVVKSSMAIKDRVFHPLEIFDRDVSHFVNPDGSHSYLIHTNEEVANKLRQIEFITSVEKSKVGKEPYDFSFFKDNPRDTLLQWTTDDYGPFMIPKVGSKIQLDAKNIAIYKSAIKFYEGNENVEEKDGQLLIGGQAVSEYTFKKNYYFMMGDNRHNSADSRAWGFVPEDYIVGKALFVWWSVEPDKKWSDIGEKVRWNRIFSLID